MSERKIKSFDHDHVPVDRNINHSSFQKKRKKEILVHLAATFKLNVMFHSITRTPLTWQRIQTDGKVGIDDQNT